MPIAAALDLRGIVKEFGVVRALDGASFAVRPGTLHALLGENGAGKTTLMRVAFGMVAPDAGEVRVGGVVRRFASPAAAMAAGLGMVHQHFTIVPAMTVAENVALGRRGFYDAAAAAARVRRIGEQTGLALDPNARAGELGVAAQQRLEIVKALARDARILVLDEPAAVLTPAEAAELLRWLRGFVDAGATAVLITHKLRDTITYADDVTVLRRGATVATLPAGRASETSLAALMLGGLPTSPGEATSRGGGMNDAPSPDGIPAWRETDGVARTPELVVAIGASRHVGAERTSSSRGADAAVVVRARDLRLDDTRGVTRVRGATFALRAGEIVGVAAVEGSGQDALLRALAGRVLPSGGTLDRPTRAAFIPEDRHRDALLLDGSLTENVALFGAGARRGRLRWRAIAERTVDLLTRFDVRAGGVHTSARTLSGGNQQKFVVARELAGDGVDVPALVVAENPTRGLDIRATAAVHARLRKARDAGAAVVMYSSDLDEVLALADRVLSVYNGEVRMLPPDRELVGRAMLGAS